jgi:hypothetical protein
MNSNAAEQIDRIKKLLGGTALMKETLPTVTFFNAQPLIAANIQIVPFQNGLPGSARLIFSGGASIVVDTENAPCRYPAAVIERHHRGFGAKFIDAARHRRGVTGWVEKEGAIKVGDGIKVHLPPQRIYGPAV